MYSFSFADGLAIWAFNFDPDFVTDKSSTLLMHGAW